MSNPAPYGFCPQCGAAGLFRERRPNGDDTCDNGHKYPSLEARNMSNQPQPADDIDSLNQAFEAEFKVLCPNKSLLKLSASRHQYQDPNTSLMWEFFKRGHNFG